MNSPRPGTCQHHPNPRQNHENTLHPTNLSQLFNPPHKTNPQVKTTSTTPKTPTPQNDPSRVNPKPGETTHTILKRENQTKNQLLARLEKTHKHRRLRGYRWAKQILLNASALCESPLEAAFSWHWLANSYPPFKRQHEFGHKKHAPYRADIYIPNKNLIIELDGASKLQQPGAHQDQTTRENIIHQHGYHLIRLNLPQVVAGHPVLKTATQITQTPPKHTRYLWARTKNLALNQLKTLRTRP